MPCKSVRIHTRTALLKSILGSGSGSSVLGDRTWGAGAESAVPILLAKTTNQLLVILQLRVSSARDAAS